MSAARSLAAAALLGAVALAAHDAGAQGAPAAPGVPAAPRPPAAPPAPASPPARVDRLSVALLAVDARRGSVSSLVVDLEGALVEVIPQGRRRRLGPLAQLLAGTLPPGGLDAARARELAVGLAGSLGQAGTDVEAALATVRQALAGAGVAGPDIVLIERELARGRRAH